MKTLFTSTIALLLCANIIASENLKAGIKADKQSGSLPLYVSFAALGDNEKKSYKWDFGNGNTSMLKAPTTMFVNPGTYKVKLMVSDGVQTDSSFMNINVEPNPDMINMYRKKSSSAQ